MLNETLDIKYRPRNFDELIQSQTVKDIRYLVEQKTLPQFLIFHGNPGTGKSSLAFVIAKALQCEESNPPCGNCEECERIESTLFKEGKGDPSTGIYTFDMGLKSNEEYISEIAEAIQSGTLFTDNKVIIIEELQKTDKSSQDMLLRTLEFIPEGVYVIVTCSSIRRINQAIRSRAKSYIMTYPTKEELFAYLYPIVEKEGLSRLINKQTLKMIIENGKCQTRNILKDLSTVTPETPPSRIATLFNTESYSEKGYFDYFKAAEGNIVDIVLFIDGLKEPLDFLNNFKYFVGSLIKYEVVKSGINHKDAKEFKAIHTKFPRVFKFTLLDDLLKLGYIQNDEEAKLHLLNMAYKLNDRLYRDASNQGVVHSEILKKSEVDKSRAVLDETPIDKILMSKGILADFSEEEDTPDNQLEIKKEEEEFGEVLEELDIPIIKVEEDKPNSLLRWGIEEDEKENKTNEAANDTLPLEELFGGVSIDIDNL